MKDLACVVLSDFTLMQSPARHLSAIVANAENNLGMFGLPPLFPRMP